MRRAKRLVGVVAGACLFLSVACASILGVEHLSGESDGGGAGEAGEKHRDATPDDSSDDRGGSGSGADVYEASLRDAGSGSGSGNGPPGCTSGSQRCSGAGIETCRTDGQWGQPWMCASGACADGACTQPTTMSAPSCATTGPGVSNCGEAGTSSCCASFEVAGGTYHRTYTTSDAGPVDESNAATVSGYRLDEYDVTVGRFRRFMKVLSPDDSDLPDGSVPNWLPTAGSGKHVHLNEGEGLANSQNPGTYESGWNGASWSSEVAPTNESLLRCDSSATTATWTTSVGANENLPINCVNWYEAYAFCIWDEGFLPSEAEWEYAAAGGDQQREYPWGSADPGTANRYAIYGNGDGGCYFPDGGACTSAQNIAPVGLATAGAGRWRQLDLGGNIWEWVLDWYATYDAPCTDCAQLTISPDSSRVERGGAFSNPKSAMFPTDRYWNVPSYRQYGIEGFRCARTP